MGKGTKMCKYKEFGSTDVRSLIHSKQSITCTNLNITEEHVKLVDDNQLYCSRRLCPFYESK